MSVLLSPVIQNEILMTPALPPKDHVIFVRVSDVHIRIYGNQLTITDQEKSINFKMFLP